METKNICNVTEIEEITPKTNAIVENNGVLVKLNLYNEFDKQNQKTNYFLVERGISGTWIYEKWSDGIAKCWGTLTSEHTTGSGNTVMPGESTYVKKKNDFPSGLFLSTPIVICSAIDSGTGSATSSTDSATTKDLCVVNVWGNEAALNEANVFAVGKWK